MKTFLFAIFAVALSALSAISGCNAKADEVHALTPDEMRRANINAEAHFNQEWPAGTDVQGNLVKKKGSFSTCRPQDSNSNNLVTCTGAIPNMQGQFVTITKYCGYNSGAGAIQGCNDKDQK